jgi:hypothetical protein
VRKPLVVVKYVINLKAAKAIPPTLRKRHDGGFSSPQSLGLRLTDCGEFAMNGEIANPVGRRAST